MRGTRDFLFTILSEIRSVLSFATDLAGTFRSITFDAAL